MSDATRFDGIAQIERCDSLGMITLRGDLSAKPVKTAATRATGATMPGVNEVRMAGTSGLCWMSPDELLAFCPYDDVEKHMTKMQTTLKTTHALLANVSDARAVFRLSGPATREVLAKLCPVDLSPDTFRPGMLRRTRMAQVPAAFWMLDDTTFQIVCFRSVGDYMFNLLKAAAQTGSDVDAF